MHMIQQVASRQCRHLSHLSTPPPPSSSLRRLLSAGLQARLRLREQLLLERLELLGRHAVRVGLVALPVLLGLLELAVRLVDLGYE